MRSSLHEAQVIAVARYYRTRAIEITRGNKNHTACTRHVSAVVSKAEVSAEAAIP